MSLLDGVFMVSQPETVGNVYAVLQEELFAHTGIMVHGGKTKVVLEQIARNEGPRRFRVRHSLFETEVSRAPDIA